MKFNPVRVLSPAHKAAVLTPLKDIAKLNLQLKDSLTSEIKTLVRNSKALRLKFSLEEVATGRNLKSKAVTAVSRPI